MQTYVVVRRGAWATEAQVSDARARAAVEVEHLSELVTWIRSYVFAEVNGTVGSVCVYEAVSPEMLRRHAAAAALPVDEIVEVNETVIVRPDTVAA
jgi:uncharacterized protein DUF4242